MELQLVGLQILSHYLKQGNNNMLLDNVVKKGDVVTLKLTAGEEVVGTFDSVENGAVRLRKPFCVVQNPESGGPALAPFLMTADPDQDLIFTDLAIHPVKSSKDFADAYTSATSNILR